MKKLNGVLFFLVFTHLNAFGQNKLSIGVGPIYSMFKFSDFVETTPKFGFQANVAYGFPINESITILPEIQTSLESFSVGINNSDQDDHRVLFFKFLPQFQKKLSGPFSIYAGPGLTYVIREYTKNGYDLFVPVFYNAFKKISGGVFGGISYKIQKITFSSKYYYGLTNLGNIEYRDQTGAVKDDFTLKNSSIQLSASYTFE